MTSQKTDRVSEHEIVWSPIGGKDRAKDKALTFDAVQSAPMANDHGSSCNELQEREIQSRLAIAER